MSLLSAGIKVLRDTDPRIHGHAYQNFRLGRPEEQRFDGGAILLVVLLLDLNPD